MIGSPAPHTRLIAALTLTLTCASLSVCFASERRDPLTTELHAAAARGDLAAVRAALDAGADTDPRDPNGVTPLLLAVLGGHRDVAAALLEHDADANADGLLPAHATIGPRLEIDVASRLHATSLLVAVHRADAPMARMLLDRGAEATFATPEGMFPLLRAAFDGHTALAQLLLEGGAEPNGTEAVEAELLIAEGLSEQAGVERGKEIEIRPLHAAAHAGHAAIVTILLERGADADALMNGSFPALQLAAYRGHVEVIAALLDGRADIDASDESGMTALHTAIREGRGTVVELLIERDADFAAATEDGATPLLAAAETNDVRSAARLLEAGARLDARDGDGATALHLASGRGHEPMLRWLVDRGLAVNSRNTDGETPLHAAAAEGMTETLTLLLSRGADVNARADDGSTPLDAALAAHRNEAADLLRARGGRASVSAAPAR